MKQTNYHVIGVMSGTSLDGVDVAEIHFTISEATVWQFEITHAETIPYSEAWKTTLQQAISFSEGELDSLNLQYTKYLAEVISAFITRNSIVNLDAVCSHGHTILHQPDKGVTLQIGNLPQLATLLEEKVVCDFRVQDVAFGGQGAPLVPIGDGILFRQYDYCLNLGGFANCSFDTDGTRIAYDICPVNIVLNTLAEKLSHPYDAGGEIAKRGRLDEDLLQQLNQLEFYRQSAPKSLGLEWVQQYIQPLLDASEASVEDKLNTFTEHVAIQLSLQFKKESSVLITGGGVYNDFLIARLMHHKKLNVVIPSSILIEYKEALIFGLLGVLKLRGEINCLASVTGAKMDHSSGKIFFH
ncbi:anhydro-N-acetylmuramic acid kinase [Ulvibacter sp. MAR_2010_11]|uniref:anhydro-N-acetylmuramic acid kinase n=1 Tax=Ulvibacter sp. MAR_2010_11 TaxID=1250229 RepID=UPI000C2C6A48|nr:anhydro-N-acetylmuramic acid kinase [Ulvibacter sp. MAR_2010_11]PKA83411.1 anhydro-N-acetylmuramic acid kinase [Ulvibacter sp. MAR_2010_11]